MALPPQVEQAIAQCDEFMATYPALTQYGMFRNSKARIKPALFQRHQ